MIGHKRRQSVCHVDAFNDWLLVGPAYAQPTSSYFSNASPLPRGKVRIVESRSVIEGIHRLFKRLGAREGGVGP